MLQREITFPDFDGEMITETFWFNLTKAEIAEMFLSHEGGDFAEYLREIVRAENGGEVIAAFKKILSASVGKREGKRFTKNEEITAEFMESNAYSELFVELIKDPGAMASFIKAVVPADMAETIAENEQTSEKKYTDAELLSMSDAEFERVAGRNPRDMTKQHLQIAFERKNNLRKTA